MSVFSPSRPKQPSTPPPGPDAAAEAAQKAADSDMAEARKRRGLAANILTSEQGLAGMKGKAGELRVGSRALLGQ